MDFEKWIKQNIRGNSTPENFDVISWLGIDLLNDDIIFFNSLDPQPKEKWNNK